MDRDENFYKKFFTIFICLREELIQHKYKKGYAVFLSELNQFDKYAISNCFYNSNFDSFDQLVTVYFPIYSKMDTSEAIHKYVMANIYFKTDYDPLLKTYFLQIIDKSNNNPILHWYYYDNDDFDDLLEDMQEIAPHIYDAIYLNWTIKYFDEKIMNSL